MTFQRQSPEEDDGLGPPPGPFQFRTRPSFRLPGGILRWAVPIVMPAGIVVGVLIWIVPPMVLLLSLAGFGPGGTLGVGPNGWVTWSAWITGLSVLAWSLIGRRLGAPFWTGAFYPLASGVVNYIFLRSWIRGGRVEWKGREYRV